MSLSVSSESIHSDYSFEPDLLDGFSLAPFAGSQSLVGSFESYIAHSSWHGLWIVPLSSAVNLLASPLLIVASLVNTLSSFIACCFKKSAWASHHISTAHDTLLYAGVSFIRIFAATYNPLRSQEVHIKNFEAPKP